MVDVIPMNHGRAWLVCTTSSSVPTLQLIQRGITALKVPQGRCLIKHNVETELCAEACGESVCCNGSAVSGSVSVKEGDEIKVVDTVLTFVTDLEGTGLTPADALRIDVHRSCRVQGSASVPKLRLQKELLEKRTEYQERMNSLQKDELDSLKREVLFRPARRKKDGVELNPFQGTGRFHRQKTSPFEQGITTDTVVKSRQPSPFLSSRVPSSQKDISKVHNLPRLTLRDALSSALLSTTQQKKPLRKSKTSSLEANLDARETAWQSSTLIEKECRGRSKSAVVEDQFLRDEGHEFLQQISKDRKNVKRMEKLDVFTDFMLKKGIC